MADVLGSTSAGGTTHSDVFGDGRLLKEVLLQGSGLRPELGDAVNIHYLCRLVSSDLVLDSTKQRGGPFAFTLGESEVIPGLEQAVGSMQGGEQAVFTVHPELALGSAGCSGGAVPPCATGASDPAALAASMLRLEVELLEVSRRQEAAGTLEVASGLSQEERLQRAMKAKEAGNTHFKASDLQAAAARYQAALELLGYIAKANEGESGADASTEAGSDEWVDVARKEARDKVALSCFLNLAQCELKLERFLLALEHAGLALAIDPESSKAVYRRGLAAMGAGLLDQAKADLVEAAKREPRNAEVRAQLQECQRRAQASEKKDRSTFGGMFGRGTIYSEDSR